MKNNLDELISLLDLGIDNKPHNFLEFCMNAGYPPPFEIQQRWVDELVLNADYTRLFLGARAYGKTDYLTICGSAWRIFKDPKSRAPSSSACNYPARKRVHPKEAPLA